MTDTYNRAFTKKTLNRIKKIHKEETANEDLINLRELSENDIKKFLHTGERVFLRKEIIFGEEELVKIKLEQSLATIRTFYINNAIIQFSSNPSSESYNSLCRAYFWDILTYMQVCLNLKNSPALYLESDICLLYIFVLTYWPQYVDTIEPFIIKGLETVYDKRFNGIRTDKGDYGKNTLFPLALFLSEKYNRPQSIKDSLLLFRMPSTESYSFVLDNIFTTNENVLNECIVKLSTYHINNSKTSDLTYPFHKEQWIYFPIEIISLIRLRNSYNFLDIDITSNTVINQFKPFINHLPEIDGLTFDLYHKMIV